MTASEYMVPSEYGNHGVQKNKQKQTRLCVRKTESEHIVVICFTRYIEI